MANESEFETEKNRDESVEGESMGDRSDTRADSLVFRRAVWLVWWAGTVLILMSWFNIVSNTVGWIGFAAAVASSVASTVVNKYWRLPR